MDIQSESMMGQKEKKLTAAAYLRVSLTRQKKEGYSLDAQMERIQKFVEKKEFYLPENLIFKEEKPATKVYGHERDELSIIDSFTERPILTQLLRNAQQRKFKHLIIYSRDRLSRVVEDTIALELFFKRCGIDVHYIKDGENIEDTDSEVGRLIHIIFTSLAEMEGNLLSSRVKDGGRACIGKGRWAGGRIPFGYVPAYNKNESEDKKKWDTILEKDDFDSKLVEQVYKLYLRGMGYRRIANVMNQNYGFIEWSKNKVEGIIKNQTYTGQIAWDRRGGRRDPRRKNKNPLLSPLQPQNSIIDTKIWNEIVDQRQKRSINKDPYYHDTKFILKDKLVCSKCERTMKPKNPGKNKSNIYKCANTKDERKACNTIIPIKLVEDEFIKYMQNDIFKINDKEKNKDIFWNEYDKKFDKRKNEILSMIEEVEKKISKYKNILDKIEKHILIENDECIKEALNTQHVIYNTLIDKYEESRDLFKKKSEVVKKDREELYEVVQLFLPGLFIKRDSKDLIRIRREFIINFIDKISVAYDKNNKKVTIDEIVFMPPEFIESP
ncbi:recombinase family protein [Tepidibacter sp. Z1-5]|uniref:recombinase family protein n=1 Tax=Tepidibacter sp. Z1-5 TaxID=3134138 RepID=UPI0030C24F83